MLKPRPLTAEFALVWALDPAVDVDRLSAATETEPDPKPEDFADPEQFSAALVEASRARFARRWRQAVETLNFGPTLRPGEQPSQFVFRALRGVAMEAFRRTCSATEDPASWRYACILAFRVCLVRVDNLPMLQLGHSVDPLHPDLGPMVSTEAMAVLDQIGIELRAPYNEIAASLGSEVVMRSVRPSPK